MKPRQWWIDPDNNLALSTKPQGITASRYVRVVESTSYEELIQCLQEVKITVERLRGELSNMNFLEPIDEVKRALRDWLTKLEEAKTKIEVPLIAKPPH